ncbi:hypothetical protein GQ55_2G220400 [Panicum hallii var. hallii]|uniref:Uncharacterized protein n=1 Tax=Panicum hallii var. hallii TaxID=1504633 RepID=A0A2T7ER84_9POAL|nr:hypothetical protein GQ55_2G220400 [Panicum hallii var. hallii]
MMSGLRRCKRQAARNDADEPGGGEVGSSSLGALLSYYLCCRYHVVTAAALLTSEVRLWYLLGRPGPILA